MDIQIDTREKQRAIRKILKTFDDNGVKHFSSKLLVGDYMSLDNPQAHHRSEAESAGIMWECLPAA